MSLLCVECKCGCRVKKFKNLINFISLKPTKTNLECPNCGRKYDLKRFYKLIISFLENFVCYEMPIFTLLVYYLMMLMMPEDIVLRISEAIFLLFISFLLSVIIISSVIHVIYLFFPHKELN